MLDYIAPVLLLIGSKVFMPFAWYGHLKFKDRPMWIVIILSWSIAFFEYCQQVPGNRIGDRVYNPAQLKTIQENITPGVVLDVLSNVSGRDDQVETLGRLRPVRRGDVIYLSGLIEKCDQEGRFLISRSGTSA